MTRRDPLRVLSRDPAYVTVCGLRITIPYQPAAAWLGALGNPFTTAGALADCDGREAILRLLVDKPAALHEVRQESLRLLSEASGRRWWEAVRLAGLAASPDVLGRLVVAGVDPWQRTFGEWCAAMYTLATQNAEEKERIKFEMQLSFPPAGFEDEWDDGADDFEAIAAAMRTMPGAADRKA